MNLSECPCQEASPRSHDEFIACGAPGAKMVFHQKDRRAYVMCAPCADHNIRSRGGEELRPLQLVESFEEAWDLLSGDYVTMPDSDPRGSCELFFQMGATMAMERTAHIRDQAVGAAIHESVAEALNPGRRR